jgi:hypothetical protein
MEVRASLMMRARPLALLVSLCLALGCAGVKQNPGSGAGGAKSGAAATGDVGGTGTGGTGANSPPPPPSCGTSPCTDFPASPITDASANLQSAMSIFGAAGSGNASGGPCLFEPQNGTLFPNNWLRPRFSWTAPSGQNLFELRVQAGNQANQLVVYTTATSWTMDKTTWAGLAGHTQDMPITVTIRGASANGGTPSVGSSNVFTIAPVSAMGSLVYWSPSGTTNGGTTMVGKTELSGFSVGDDSIEQVLVPSDISPTWQTLDQGETKRAVSCIGCHTSTPDGNFIAFNDNYPWGGVLASGQAATLGMPPTPAQVPIGAGGYAALIQPWLGIQTYSANHWKAGDHIVVAPIGTCGGLQPCASGAADDQDQQPGLAWIDLENGTALAQGQSPGVTLKGTAWNWIYQPVTGQYAAAPSWSHQPGNDFIVFTMTSNVVSGRLGTGTGHLYKVPYSKSGPQPATALSGDGSDSNFAQYYGTLSPDDTLVAFDKAPAAAAAANHADLNTSDASGSVWSGMYMQGANELNVMSSNGGPATRLAANDPPQCPGQPTSPGINNTWAKWSPQVSSANGSTYYWIIFSSWRQGMKDANGDPIAQLYATAVVQPEVGPLMTYPAIYLWNQVSTISNFTPAWDYFQIPIIIDTGI